jgi:predicted enzyme related to lactoylglutathione lyase
MDHPAHTSITLGAVNVDADDPPALARFWSDVLGGDVQASSAEFAHVANSHPGGFAMFFSARTGARPERQSQHLDLTVPWGSRGAEVERLTALGASLQWEVLDDYPWVKWSTLTDPEGNLFCVAEHPPAAS